jgi:hypothetical protein
MPAVIGTATSSDWSFGGALLTFFFPIGLFIVVAASLYLAFTRPHAVPGRKPFPAAGVVPGEQPSAAAEHDPEVSSTDPETRPAAH